MKPFLIRPSTHNEGAKRQGAKQERNMQDDKKPDPKAAEKQPSEQRHRAQSPTPSKEDGDYTYSDWASI
ncbi:hypothetical protein [Actibacterium mucosum]|uniref:hypothetical protein n=1 Tax=Actibacterium mucosum TaxID=1087332 RepID=UPI0013788F06|nr:hypothetical protein [Actibacterium mucosum]